MQGSLKNKTTNGVLWSFIDLMSNHGIQFIIQIILARLLLPEHFGVIGMVLVFISISHIIIDSGFSTALIRESDPSPKDYSTVFYCNLVVALVIYFLLYKSAFFISSFFNEPLLVPLLRVLSLVLIINSLGIVHKVILTRNVRFRTQTKISIISGLLSGIIAIIFAFNGYGVWSLVIKTIAMQFFQLVLLWVYIKWIPVYSFSITSFKRLFGFSSKTLLSSLIGTFYNNIYYVVIGRFYSVADLGYYTNAYNLSNVFSNTLTASIQRVTYPVLSSIKEDEEKLKRNFRIVIRMSVFIVFPIMLGLVVIGTPLINLLFGEKWLPMVIYLQLICLAGLFHPLYAINSNILQVKGKADIYLLLEVTNRLIMTLLIVLALWFKTGMQVLIGTAVLYSIITFYTSAFFSAREISYPIKDQLRDIGPILIASLLMGSVVYMCGRVLPGSGLFELIFQICIGVIVYVLICKIMRIKEFDISLQLILSFFNKGNN
ncbi:lipopolysaccharide biosynthesis protein [Sporosarcina luteola]|uniref:lipopolysaccharide biosynthesis protein n=1 Tax=Sporosarcina luteola TaxID=582850 RepID=UPI0020401F0B|nr:lipopolysaccharide biosynthesis protein [Sporosarcina luteola]MCM3636547.1 lipopolysaccharide biosynthesis protein [Sporosarcina luteola]